jgi:transcriptional regulator with GAF, ATPase, and Fis domain
MDIMDEDEILQIEHICEEIFSTDNIEEFITNLTENIRQILNAERCTLFLYDKYDNSLKSVVYQANLNEKVTIPLNIDSIAGFSFLNDRSIIINDVNDKKELKSIDDNLTYHECWKNVDVPRTKTMISVPIKIKNDKIGVLVAVNKFPNFTQDDVNKAEKISRILGLGMKNLIHKNEMAELLNLNYEIINNINEGIILTDFNDNIIGINDKLIEMMGYRMKKEEMINKNIFEIFPILKDGLEKIEISKEKFLIQEIISGVLKIKIVPVVLNHLFEKSLKKIIYIIEY